MPIIPNILQPTINEPLVKSITDVPSYAKLGPYVTPLHPQDEDKFQNWVNQNNIPWRDEPKADYDMRGYWKSMVSGNPDARTQINPTDNKPHYPDTWKTPYHRSFSNESMYATPQAPHWEGESLIPTISR